MPLGMILCKYTFIIQKISIFHSPDFQLIRNFAVDFAK